MARLARPSLAAALAACQSLAAAQPAATDLRDLPRVGRIDARSGQVIERVHVTNPSGPCIVIGRGVRQVTVRHARIGPCGPAPLDDYGVFILDGATEITITDNVIHAVGTGVKAHKARGPILVERNLFYEVRGPLWNGQAVQFNGVQAGSASSRIRCNVSDAWLGRPPIGYEDHISLYDSHGSAAAPIVVAYNRIRGGSSRSGGGITVGDQGGSWIEVTGNRVVQAVNSGIGVAGGHQIRVTDNLVDNRGPGPAARTHMAYFVRAFSACSDIRLQGNRGVARLWLWGETDGRLHPGYRHGPELCSRVDDRDNQFGDERLDPDSLWQKPEACR